jgi:hypothetical protein
MARGQKRPRSSCWRQGPLGSARPASITLHSCGAARRPISRSPPFATDELACALVSAASVGIELGVGRAEEGLDDQCGRAEEREALDVRAIRNGLGAVERPLHWIEHRQWLRRKRLVAAAAQPIHRVLQAGGHRGSVLGGDKQHAIGAADAFSQGGHRRARSHWAPACQASKARAARDRFGPAVAEIVDGCTDAYEEPKPLWRPRKEAYLAHLAIAPPSVRLVSNSDKLHNARSILSDLRVLGPALWALHGAQGRHALVLPIVG